MAHSPEEIEKRFLKELRHHLSGWKSKVEADFSEANFDKELEDLRGDPVYSKFGFDSPEYVLVRFMGRISISIGRRLGEIYDKIPRMVAAARFGLSAEQIAPKLNGLELDIGIRYSQVDPEDRSAIDEVVARYLPNVDAGGAKGLGIEIRYNFNPNDSARLRKDVDMASYVLRENLLPLYLIFSTISPREEAISRLTREGWVFLIGEIASGFTDDLFGFDLARILEKPTIQEEIQQEVNGIMEAIVSSYAFKQVVKKQRG